MKKGQAGNLFFLITAYKSESSNHMKSSKLLSSLLYTVSLFCSWQGLYMQHIQAFMGNACNHMSTPLHRPVTSEVCNISHALIALKWQFVVASSMGFYDESNTHWLLCLSIFLHLISSEMTVIYCFLGNRNPYIHRGIAFKLTFQRSHATTHLDGFRCVISSTPIIIFP